MQNGATVQVREEARDCSPRCLADGDLPGMYSMICPRLELLEGPMAVGAVSGFEARSELL